VTRFFLLKQRSAEKISLEFLSSVLFFAVETAAGGVCMRLAFLCFALLNFVEREIAW